MHKLSIGEYVPKTVLKRDEQIFYEIKIGDEFNELEDLVIKIIPLNYESDPDIFISKTDKFPNSTLTSEWQCQSYGKDTCVVNSLNLTRGDTFRLGVICHVQGNVSCEYQLRVLLTEELELEDGVEFQTYLYKEDARVFTFTIPSSLVDTANSSLIIKAASYRGTVHDFNLKMQSTVPMADGSFRERLARPAWKKGQVIRLDQENWRESWCHECVFKILLDVKDEDYYHIMVQSSEATPLLQNQN